MEIEWIKLYLSVFRSSRKIANIERMKNGDTIVVIWFKLLCLAGEINDDGAIYITPQIPFDVESLADEVKKPKATVERALKVFCDYGMIIMDDAGFIRVKNWEKYQSVDRMAEIREYNRLAQQRSRERRRQAQTSTDCQETETEDVNDKSMTSQRCQDTEEEGEEDEELEIHSFTRSITREREEEKRKLLGGNLGKGVVFLSDVQWESLLDELSLDEINHYVSVVADCILSGKVYKKKTHYQAILDMAHKDRRVNKG